MIAKKIVQSAPQEQLMRNSKIWSPTSVHSCRHFLGIEHKSTTRCSSLSTPFCVSQQFKYAGILCKEITWAIFEDCHNYFSVINLITDITNNYIFFPQSLLHHIEDKEYNGDSLGCLSVSAEWNAGSQGKSWTITKQTAEPQATEQPPHKHHNTQEYSNYWEPSNRRQHRGSPIIAVCWIQPHSKSKFAKINGSQSLTTCIQHSRSYWHHCGNRATVKPSFWFTQNQQTNFQPAQDSKHQEDVLEPFDW